MSFELQQLTQLYVVLPLEAQKALSEIVQKKRYRKKEIVIKAGATEQYLHIISAGIMRIYYTKAGKEITIDIVSEGAAMCSLSSYLSGTASRFTVEALQDTIVYSFLKKDIESLSVQHAGIKTLADGMIASMLVRMENKDIEFAPHKSAIRLQRWVKSNGDLLNRVPQIYLASYFKVSFETFSRLKTDLFRTACKGVKACRQC